MKYKLNDEDEIKETKNYYLLTLHIQEDSEYGIYVYYLNGNIQLNFYTEENNINKVFEEINDRIKEYKENKNEN